MATFDSSLFRVFEETELQERKRAKVDVGDNDNETIESEYDGAPIEELEVADDDGELKLQDNELVRRWYSKHD